jgi:thimet oligopeptidase
MLENFVWEPAILRQISSNAAGEPLPDAVVASMNAARHFNQAWNVVGGDIFYALVDQRLHTATPPVDTTAVWQAAKAAYTVDDVVPGTFREASITHLMGGYEGSLYAYPWAKVYAMDLFTAFRKQGLQDPAVGLRYRQEILAPARTFEPDVLVRRFLGRAMKPDAYYADLGMKVGPR